MAIKTSFHLKLIFLILIFVFPKNLYCQDFYQSYKTDFLEPYQKVIATPDKEDDRVFFQDQVKRINAYNPPSLQRFIAKQIVDLANNDVETQKECIEAGLILIRKNWLRGKDKIELLKKLDKVTDTCQNAIKFDRKKDKLELYKTSYLILQELIDEHLSLLKPDEAQAYFQKWKQAGENVRDPKITNSLDSEISKMKAKFNNCIKLSRSLANLKSQDNSLIYKKAIANDCLLFLFSPESALEYLEGTTLVEETSMILAFSKFLNKQNKTATAPTFLSDRDLILPPVILFDRLTHVKEFQSSVNYAKEKFDEGEFQYYHHARDLAREVIRKSPDDTPLDEKQLVNFFAWVDSILKDELDDSQYLFISQLKPKIAEVKASIQDPQNLISINKSETFFNDKFLTLEKKLKLTKYRIPAPAQEEPNEKEKQWLAKPLSDRMRIIDSMQDKIKQANPGKDRISFLIEPNNLTLNIYRESQFDNFTPFKEIPFKNVILNQCGSVNDFSFLKDSPVVSIEASWSGIKNISALKNMKTLRRLNLQGLHIYDLVDLKGLNLTSLNIGNTEVKDLTPLKLMPLNDLNIERTHILSIAPVEYMPLTYLNANDCDLLNNLDGLESTNIQILRLDRCKALKSLEPISRLQLKELYIEDTPISDLSPINKSMLTHFYFCKCPNIRSIGEISMMNIEFLGINNIQFINFIIKYNFPLKSLRLSGTAVQDLSPLVAFDQLDTLDLSDCDYIRDLRTLKNMSINNLFLNNCKGFKSFQGISDLNIKNIWANRSELKDLVTLNSPKLEKLEMRDTPELLSLKGISQCSNLKEFDGRWPKKLKDVADLENSNIETLMLDGANPKFKDIQTRMKKLKFFDLNR